MDDEWRDAMSGDPPALPEWFLPKAEVLDEENVEVSEAVRVAPSPQPPPNRVHGEDNEMMDPATGVAAAGKRTAVEEMPLDEATEQKQRKRIQRREAYARFKERKRAYCFGLESSVKQLKEENARLLEEVAKLREERDKQLMENMIPVVDTRRPLRILRRAHSANW